MPAPTNLNSLAALDRLLATRSVRRAADALGVTQSAMSHTLARLRHELADPLLVRAGNAMVLTPRAEALARPLRDALAALDAALRAVEPFEPSTADVAFHIAASDAVAVHVGPPLLQRLAVEAPGVHVTMVPYDRAHVPEALATGSVDLAIGPPMEIAARGILTRALYTSDFVAVVRRGHPAGRRLTLDRYCALGHVVVSLGGGASSAIDEALAKRGRSRRIVTRVPYFVAAPLLVASSDLVLTAPRTAVARLAGALGLVMHDPPLAVPAVKIAAFFHERLASSPAHRWLRELVGEVV